MWSQGYFELALLCVSSPILGPLKSLKYPLSVIFNSETGTICFPNPMKFDHVDEKYLNRNHKFPLCVFNLMLHLIMLVKPFARPTLSGVFSSNMVRTKGDGGAARTVASKVYSR